MCKATAEAGQVAKQVRLDRWFSMVTGGIIIVQNQIFDYGRDSTSGAIKMDDQFLEFECGTIKQRGHTATDAGYNVAVLQHRTIIANTRSKAGGPWGGNQSGIWGLPKWLIGLQN